MSLQHIQKNSPGLLPKPAKFEKNPPNGYRVIRKTKCGAGGAGGAGGARSSPIHKQASLAGRLIREQYILVISLLLGIPTILKLIFWQKSYQLPVYQQVLTHPLCIFWVEFLVLMISAVRGRCTSSHTLHAITLLQAVVPVSV